MNKITVKSEFLKDLRRFPVNTQIGFKEFIETVSNLYKLDSIRLKYLDEEGDSISITNDEELQEAIEFAQSNKKLLRVIVTKGNLLDSWIVIDNKLPDEVRDLCNNIKSLTNQLSEKVVTDNNNNNKSSGELSPTAQQIRGVTNQTKDEVPSVLAVKLPSWGKNSMYSEDFVRELNSENTKNGNTNDINNNNINNININNNNNGCNGLIEGQRTDLGANQKIVAEKPRQSISQVVSENSASIVKDLKDLTSKIATLVIKSGTDIPLDVKDNLIQTNMKLAEMTIANCHIFSNNALDNCNQSSAMAVNIVNSAVDNQKKLNVENEITKKNLDQVCDKIRHDTVETCSNLSHTTAENCMKGANSIRDLIMNL